MSWSQQHGLGRFFFSFLQPIPARVTLTVDPDSIQNVVILKVEGGVRKSSA